MRKRVFSRIFLTALVTLIVTVSLLLVAVHSGLSQDLRERLSEECNYIAAAAATGEEQELQRIGNVYADRITLVGTDGTVLYDNKSDAAQMENHASGPEIAEALAKGVGESSRRAGPLAGQAY